MSDANSVSVSDSSASAKHHSDEDIQISIQIDGRQRFFWTLTERNVEAAKNAAVVDLQARLSRVQDDLEVARKETFDLWSKLVECKSDLKRERHINDIAWTYIPEAQRDEYILDWPCGQMVWSGPSSPSPASNAHSRQFSEDVVKILELEQTDRSARLCEAAEGHAEDGTIN